ncbi:MAG: FAD-dependent oxidoreductase [Anaerolineae bacterium]|jgi:formate dehydrogenase (NADP+) beta subunit|nr:FAD-dependent oxidoreductase [Anaerolineae bacterium]MBT7076008.1 FAD-dependent oxidoreductase [Anaerolineae bacterium]MBT7782582.1 FAD-dependent oxidoreductase [Anaerolineae bacterium]
MSKDQYKVKVPTTDTYREMVKCQAACPVQTDARGYIMAVAAGDLERGYQISREPNPLSSMCGQICGAPCEIACRRGDINEDAPVAIRPLKKVLTMAHGPEAAPKSKVIFDPNAALDLDASNVGWSRTNLTKLASNPDRKGGKIAVIGAGPAGLSAAHDLNILGYEVTIYEAGPYAGGMIRYGVPSFRVDWKKMDAEIQEIADMGVDFKYNTRIGKDIMLNDIRKENDAVFLGVGLMDGRDLSHLEGRENEGIILAVDLLMDFNMEREIDYIGDNIIVVGGGDVAMDAARTALRAGHRKETLEEATANGAKLGARKVTLMALESWDELPASPLELEEAMEEEIEMFPSTGPKRILGKDGKVVGFETKDVASVFDEDGKFNPKFVENSEKEWECDTIIFAIGQQSNLHLVEGADDITVEPWGIFKTDNETGQTTAPDVFAGGDVAYGASLIISAVRDAHVAALSIDEYIQSKEIESTVKSDWTNLEDHVMPDNWLKYQREKAPSLDPNLRTGYTQVELCYDPDQAVEQSIRCLECSVNTIFDGELCILCNGCVDVCPWDCLKIVSLDEISGDETLHAVIEEHTGVPLNEITKEHEINTKMSVMLKDDEACTRCALCAERCPTDAITMESFRFEETLGYKN